VRALPGAGFAGANVTVPHKEAALAVADQATPAARAIGAANTLAFGEDRAITADNTDAPGLLAALPVPIAGRTALVLGAGGSARGAAAPGPADLLVNCTSIGLDGPVALPLDPAALDRVGAVVDLVYRPGGTALVRAARARGLPCADGLEVLVQQGARSFAIWT